MIQHHSTLHILLKTLKYWIWYHGIFEYDTIVFSNTAEDSKIIMDKDLQFYVHIKGIGKRALYKKWSLTLRISSVNETLSMGTCRFGHIYRRKP